jgi:hypothetical protein
MVKDGGPCQFIAALIFRMPGVPFNPIPVDGVGLAGFIQSEPEVFVFDRGTGAGFPAVLFPFTNPTGDAVFQVT